MAHGSARGGVVAQRHGVRKASPALAMEAWSGERELGRQTSENRVPINGQPGAGFGGEASGGEVEEESGGVEELW